MKEDLEAECCEPMAMCTSSSTENSNSSVSFATVGLQLLVAAVEAQSPSSNDNDLSQANFSTNSQSSLSTTAKAVKRRNSRDECKDSMYWEKRRRNNEAAKRSREKRRINDIAMEQKLQELNQQNKKLKEELDLVTQGQQQRKAADFEQTGLLVARNDDENVSPKIEIAAAVAAAATANSSCVVPPAANCTISSVQQNSPVLSAALSQPSLVSNRIFRPDSTPDLNGLSKGQITSTRSLPLSSPDTNAYNSNSSPFVPQIGANSNNSNITLAPVSTPFQPLLRPAALKPSPLFSPGFASLLAAHVDTGSAALLASLPGLAVANAVSAAAAAAQQQSILANLPYCKQQQQSPHSNGLLACAAVAQEQLAAFSKRQSPDTTTDGSGFAHQQQLSCSGGDAFALLDSASTLLDGKQYLRYKILERQGRKVEPLMPSALSAAAAAAAANFGPSILNSLAVAGSLGGRIPSPLAAATALQPPTPPATDSNSLKQCLSRLNVDLSKQAFMSSTSSSVDSNNSKPSPLSLILSGNSYNTFGNSNRRREFSENSNDSSRIDVGDAMMHSDSKNLSSSGSDGHNSPSSFVTQSSSSKRHHDIGGDSGADKYLERRKRNNEAAKRCRANRRALFEYRFRRSQELEQENTDLKKEMTKLQQEVMALRQLIVRKQNGESVEESQIQRILASTDFAASVGNDDDDDEEHEQHSPIEDTTSGISSGCTVHSDAYSDAAGSLTASSGVMSDHGPLSNAGSERSIEGEIAMNSSSPLDGELLDLSLKKSRDSSS